MTSASLVHHLLEYAANSRPDHPFLVQDGIRSSYAEVDAGANRLANLLLTYGVEPGDRVAILARNSRLYVEAWFGIQKAGAIAVPLNASSGAARLSDVLARCSAKAMIAGRGHEAAALAAAEHSATISLVGFEALPNNIEPDDRRDYLDLVDGSATAPATTPALSISADSPTNIVFTSGSTGTPLGATLSHANIVSNARSIVSSLELGPTDSVLQVLPFHYVYGQSLLTTHALVGGTIVIENRFLYPEVALDTLEKEACTGFAGVPSHFAILLNRSTLAERSLTALNYITCAGGALNPDITDRLNDVLPGRKIYVMYGATEASARLSCLAPQDLSRKRGSAGRAIPDVDLRILLPDGTGAPAGEVGEIVARGPNIMLGYWGDEEASAAVLDEHGYRTGDLGYLDEDDFLFIVGREREFIKSGAHRVSAKEIEETIFSAGRIHEVAVIGVADEYVGEKIRAYVVPTDSDQFDVDQLMAELRRTMPPYQLPAEVFGLADLPKTDSGKVKKRELVAESSARKLYPPES